MCGLLFHSSAASRNAPGEGARTNRNRTTVSRSRSYDRSPRAAALRAARCWCDCAALVTVAAARRRRGAVARAEHMVAVRRGLWQQLLRRRRAIDDVLVEEFLLRVLRSRRIYQRRQAAGLP